MFWPVSLTTRSVSVTGFTSTPKDVAAQARRERAGRSRATTPVSGSITYTRLSVATPTISPVDGPEVDADQVAAEARHADPCR